jgi:two-component system, OmpR family, sensor kinase
MSSVKRSALLSMTAVLTVVGVVALVLAYDMAGREANDFLDGQLRHLALNAGEGLSEVGAPEIALEPEDELAVEIWDSHGKLIRRAANGIELPRQPRPGYATIAAGGEDWRVYLISDKERSIQVGQRMAVRAEMATWAALEAGLPILVAIPLAWLAMGFALSRVFKRLDEVALVVATRGTESEDLVSTADVPIEVMPLVEAINGLSARLQKTVEQQKFFIANAAHELRTPLAALQIQIDNLRWAKEDEREDKTSQIRESLQRAAHLADQLLKMARLEEDSDVAARKPVELTDLLTECVAELVPLADAKGVDLGFVSRDPVTVSGAASDLKMLFGNLIDNAIRYTPEGGIVDVSIERTDASAVIEIVDTGCGIREDDLPHVFNRFFRAGSVDSEGSGLGLSIVEAVAKRYGLGVDLHNRHDRSGLRARVSLNLQ